MKNKRISILQKAYEMACHNLMCYSNNLLMDSPKPGYEKEWTEYNSEVKTLMVWLRELKEDAIEGYVGI